MNNEQRLIHLGIAICKTREEKNISIEMLSKKTSISKQRLQQIEKGKTNLHFNSLIKIAAGLKVELRALLKV